MKKYLTIFTALSIFFFSCSSLKMTPQKMEKKLVGKWRYEKIVPAALPADNQAQAEEELKSAIAGSYIEFKADNTYTMVFNSQKSEGKWSVSDDTKDIILQNKKTFLIEDTGISKLQLIIMGETEKTDVKVSLSRENS